MKIALAMIVRGADDEALVLDKCLNNISPFVDGIFITSTYKKGEKPNKKVQLISRKYDANVSHFEWVNDFALARNYSFEQVPEEYDYILWADADDIFRGLEKLRPTLEKHQSVDAWLMWYLYDFDHTNQPTVVHQKTMVVKNDKCVTWKGRIHEDLQPNRQLDIKFLEGIDRIHQTNTDRIERAKNRNLEIASEEVELKPSDPRSYWNLANAYSAVSDWQKTIEAYKIFLETSESEEEKYLGNLRLAGAYIKLDKRQQALNHYYIAIGMQPEFPDGYIQLGEAFYMLNQLDEAERYLLLGLIKKPQYTKLVVYNPRDYDYNPMMLLSKVYFQKQRPDLALPMIEGCLKIYPENKALMQLKDTLTREKDRLIKVTEKLQELQKQKFTNKEDLVSKLDSLPVDLRSHPSIYALRNSLVVKTESTGKDLVYYCGFTDHEWNPKIYKEKGFGGSEEAVINLSKQFAKEGWNVTVYANIGVEEMEDEGVKYKPFWAWNYRDKQDVLILWRIPKATDFELNASKIFIDLHDVVGEGEFSAKRLKKINKIFVKSQAHRNLFPNIPDDKIVIVPNGCELADIDEKPEKNRKLLINTSSPDRSMDVLVDLFAEVKKQVPDARLKWAYGWGVFDTTFARDTKKMAWKNNLVNRMQDVGVEIMGKLNPIEVTKLYYEGNIFAYPTEFFEIDCISARKAQLAGCYPITTDFAALNETVQYGYKVHSEKNNKNWARDYQFHYGLEDEDKKKEWVNAVIKKLNEPIENREDMIKWASQFTWSNIAKTWTSHFA